MMGKNKSSFFYDMIDLAIFVLTTAFVLAAYLVNESDNFEPVMWLFLIFAGCLIFLFFLIIGRARHLFFSLLFVSNGVCAFIANSNWLPFTFLQVWPVMGITFSLSLFMSKFYRYKKLLYSYIVPCVIICGLSVIFLFFSFKVIPISFKVVMFVLFAVCFVLITISFFIQKFFITPKKQAECP